MVFDVDKLIDVITFQAVSHQTTFYTTKLTDDGHYILIEISYLKLLDTFLHDLLSYVLHLNDVLDLVNIIL